MTEVLPLERRQELHRRALWLEYFTIGWNVIEGVVAIGAGLLASSVALTRIWPLWASSLLASATPTVGSSSHPGPWMLTGSWSRANANS